MNTVAIGGRWLAIIGVSALALLPVRAWATNGFLSHCIGANNCGMGGAGVALPQDATSAAINPALMGRIENQFFLSPAWFHPVRTRDLSGVSSPNVPAASKTEQTSKNENFVEGSAGVKYGLTNSIALGVAAYGQGGMATKYDTPRTAAGAGDSRVRYRLLHVAPTVSWTPNNWSAYGASVIVGYSDIKTDFATLPNLAETQGHNGLDRALGIGARLGGVWDVHPEVSVGAAVASPVVFQEFDKYRDVFRRSVDTPANGTVGVNWRARPDTDIAFDIKYIAWGAVHAIGLAPGRGGFGWESKPVFSVGVQHRLTDALTLRAGYNYGEAPIPDENIFANALFPAVTEHHVTIGASYKLSPTWEIAGSFFYAPKAGQTDPGTGDNFSQLGKNTKVDMWQMGAQIGLKWKF